MNKIKILHQTSNAEINFRKPAKEHEICQSNDSAEHNSKVHTFLQTKEWMSLLMTSATILEDATAKIWLQWMWVHRERIHGFDELTDGQCKQLSTDLGFADQYKSLHQVESCSIDGTIFLRFGYRQLMKPLEVLSTCVHELLHCLMPPGINAALEESLCMIAELCVRKQWLVDDDLSLFLNKVALIHPAQRCSSALLGGLTGLKNAIQEIGGANRSLRMLLQAETVEDTILSLNIPDNDFRVCKCHREKQLIYRLEEEVFGDVVSTSRQGDDLILIHGYPMRTFLRVLAKGQSLYIGSFVSKLKRRGDGSRAMALLLRVAERKGMKLVEFHSRNEPHLRDTCSKLGFKMLLTVPQFYEDGTSALLWRRIISPSSAVNL